MKAVAAFTDTYLPTINGVSYTLADWRERWRDRGGRMDVVYPRTDSYDPAPGEVPVTSLPFPFYEGYRYGLPQIPRSVNGVDVVHAHTPFAVGFGGVRLARRRDLPLVASYHTPTGEYAEYIVSQARVAAGIRSVTESWERWFFDRADVVLAPSEVTRDHLRTRVGVDAPVEVMSNGVDVERFRPVDPGDFLERYGLAGETPLVGYTGRHGHEKELDRLLEAATNLDAALAFGGDGPDRERLERRAEALGVDARFLGFLDRADLPAFYSALDAFAFPSPVETQGVVALEAMACGTPVVGVNAGALAETVDDGVTGYHFDRGDVDGFVAAIRRALDDGDRLRENCLDRRDAISMERTVDRLESLYASLA